MLHVLASGSSGNCYCIETAEELIFIDAGISKTRIWNFIKSINAEKKKITILLTHEHHDHISGLGRVLSFSNVKLITSVGTSLMLEKKGITAENLVTLESGRYYDFENFAVKPMKISHDAAEPFSFLVSVETGNVAIATDLGYISKEQISELGAADTLILECNYDKDMLAAGSYPPRLKRRVHSAKGHLCNDDAMMALAVLSSENLSRCLLAHVSEENNDYSLLEQFAKFSSDKYNIATHVLRQKTEYCFNLSPFQKLGL